MARYVKPRYKCLIKIRDNIWNNSKPLLKFKKKKWKVSRRMLMFRFSKRKKTLFFLKKIRMRSFYRIRLNMRKTFYSIYGRYKKQQFTKAIKNFKGPGLNLKLKNVLYNEPILGNKTFDNILYIMQTFESRLIVSVFRMGIFKSIQSALHFIKVGGILVNYKVIQNPFFILQENSIISLNLNYFKSILLLNKLKILKKRKRFFFKTFPGVYITKCKHLLYNFNNFKYIYIKKPDVNDLDKNTKINWDYIYYLLKLKRK